MSRDGSYHSTIYQVAILLMKIWISPSALWFPCGSFELLSWRIRQTRVREFFDAVRGTVLIVQYRVKKRTRESEEKNSYIFRALLLMFGNTDHVCKPLTTIFVCNPAYSRLLDTNTWGFPRYESELNKNNGYIRHVSVPEPLVGRESIHAAEDVSRI